MTFAAIALGAGASLGGSAIQASAGKKGAEAEDSAQLAGLDQANRTIRDAISQYDPYRRGGDHAYRQIQRMYGRAGTLGRANERALLGLERDFGQEEQGIFDRQEQGLSEYRQRNQVLDNQFSERSGAMDADFRQGAYLQDMAFSRDAAALDAGYKSSVATQDAQAIKDLYRLDQGFSKGSKKLDEQYFAEEKQRRREMVRDSQVYGEEERALRDKIAQGDITLDPGYKFRLEQGQIARERGAAARGGLLSGGTLKDLEEHSQGLASQEFGAATGRLYDLHGLGRDAYTLGRRNKESDYGLGQGAFTLERGNLEGDYERGRGYRTGDYERRRGYTTGDYSMARGYRTGDYERGRGYLTGDYERGRGYLTGDYERGRGYGREDFGDQQNFLQQSLGQRRDRFDRRYGQGLSQRQFSLDRYGRRMGILEGLNQQGQNALAGQTGLSQTLAGLYGQAGQVRGQAAAAPYQALGQFGGQAGQDLSTLALLYGLGGFDRGRPTTPGAANRYWG